MNGTNGDIVIHTDGGSRGNPGNAAIGVVIERDGTVLYEQSASIGQTTNNVAEYRAVLAAWEWLTGQGSTASAGSGRIRFLLDSELVVKQLTGQYKIKDPKMRELAAKVMDISRSSGLSYTYSSIPREQNTQADALVNRALDALIA